MVTALPLVHRIPRLSDDPTDVDFVLVQVSSNGPHPLDLHLIGTENSEIFAAKVNHNKTSTLKAKNFQGNQVQWDETLSLVLLGAEETEFTKGVEAVATTNDASPSKMTITIRKRVEGITQKLGTITLRETDVPAERDAVDLYAWCGRVIKERQGSGEEFETLQVKLEEKNQETKKLNDALVELVKLKNDSEDDLLQKFSLLLNEKKLKIRDQQRLLASANVDPEKLEEVERSRVPERDSPPGPSRARKRKASKAIKYDTDDEEEDGFEKMEVDAKAAQPDDENRRTEDEESTTDEASEDEVPAAPLLAQPTNSAKFSENEKELKAAPEPEIQVPPPKRVLPFSKKQATAPKSAAPADQSGTESDDDDEL